MYMLNYLIIGECITNNLVLGMECWANGFPIKLNNNSGCVINGEDDKDISC